MNTIALLAGARPNYMKVFPMLRVLRAAPDEFRPVLIHTGQHYDALMNDVFFKDFDMPRPDHFLGIGSGTHGAQTGRVMIALEELLLRHRPDMLVVVGDVNSTLAGALVAVKLGIPVAHLEAGLRSFDRTMPEEINRMATDAVSDLLLTSCRDADENLIREGAPAERIRFVGNIMLDSLAQRLSQAETADAAGRLGFDRGGFCLVTLHRPSNVDDPARLDRLVEQLSVLARDMPVLFPVHPRTRKMLDQQRPDLQVPGLKVIDPLGYTDFLSLELSAAAVVTDSGGIQEETSFLGVPCLTVRPNTERPITVTQGTNRLIDPSTEPLPDAILRHVEEVRRRPKPVIELWDGHTAPRVVEALREFLAGPMRKTPV